MRIAPLCQSICLIYCFFPIITHATASNSAAPPEVKTSDKGNSVDPSKTLMISEQYHFVPLGSFFQYSIASWEQGYNGKFLSKITVACKTSILSSSPNYNFIVLQTENPNSSTVYDQFNCYVRAVNEGISQLMNNCGLTQNAYIAPTGLCQNAIKQASEKMFSTTDTFLNCTDLQLDYEVVLDEEGQSNSGTMLFIVDNSGLVFNQTQPVNWINLILSLQVVTDINEEERATLYLMCGLTGIVILMMLVIAIVLKCKIHQVDKQTQDCKRDKTE